MPQSTYKITTDQGEYKVTVEDAQSPLDRNQSHIGPAPWSREAVALNPYAEGADPDADPFVQNVKNLSIGALKNIARVGQMIPGVARATDAIYGLPHGASVASTQPSNTGERIGGYVADAALAGVGGAAEVSAPAAAGLKVVPKTVAQVVTKGASNAAGATLDALSAVSQGAIKAARVGLIGTGPLTADKIGRLIGRYGVKAVKVAAEGLGLGAAIDAWMQLKK